MTAKDYPITTPYGKVAGYPLNNGFHQGIDYGCPSGTPVVVNGVTIGLSGATGYVSGAHLHVGRWVNGQVTDPGVGGGFNFQSAKVTEVHQTDDSNNGKYVRVEADGASWVYLHLSEIKVTVGQELKGVSMADDDITKYLYGAYLGRDPNKAELDSWRGRETNLLVITLVQSQEAHDYYNKVQAALSGGGTATVLKPGKYQVN